MPATPPQRRALLPALALTLGLVVTAGRAQAAEAALDYTVTTHDTLIGLSRTLLTEPKAWPEVARLNGLRDPDRLTPGQTLKLPLRLLRSAQQPARVLSTEGEVTIDGRPARAGDTLQPGQALRTGPASSAVLRLGDGSQLKFTPLSEASLDEHRRFELRSQAQADAAGEGLFASTMRLVQGSVEVLATKLRRAKPLEVTTPTAVIGVRGTEYRVRHAADTGSGTEVLTGRVRADAGRAGADVPAGYGAALRPDEAPRVTPLLPAPDLSGLPARFERPLLRFQAPAPEALRVQVAADPQFERLVRDERTTPGAEVRLAGLEDGTWHLRVRRIDSAGVEGFDAQRTVTLKARPEPPAAMAPAPGAKLAVGDVRFAWAENTDASSYRLEVAKDAGFQQLVQALDALAGGHTTVALNEPGPYHWRLASVRANGDRGPWGDAQALLLRALPEPPQGGLSQDGQGLQLSWSGRPEDRQQVELARDPGFTQRLAQAELSEPRWQVDKPEQPGTVYFRYRSVEPDGFVSPWSSTLKIEVPRDWSSAPWLLLPLLLAL